MEVIKEICDKVAVMENGKIVEFLASTEFHFEFITKNGWNFDPVKAVRTIVIADECNVEWKARFEYKALVDGCSRDPASVQNGSHVSCNRLYVTASACDFLKSAH